MKNAGEKKSVIADVVRAKSVRSQKSEVSGRAVRLGSGGRPLGTAGQGPLYQDRVKCFPIQQDPFGTGPDAAARGRPRKDAAKSS